MTDGPHPSLCVINADAHDVRALSSRLRAMLRFLGSCEFEGAQPAANSVHEIDGCANPFAAWAAVIDQSVYRAQHTISGGGPTPLASTWSFQPPHWISAAFQIGERIRSDRSNMPADADPIGSRVAILERLIATIDATGDALDDPFEGPRDALLQPGPVGRSVAAAWRTLDVLARTGEPAMRCESVHVGGLYGPSRATLLTSTGHRRQVRDEVAARIAAPIPPTGLLTRSTAGTESWTIRPLDLEFQRFRRSPEPDPVEMTSIVHRHSDGLHPAKRPK